MESKHILRVKALKLCRFRGFVGNEPVPLDTDADVVLLTGPNGFGKTSVIDALCLVLNGYYYPERLPLASVTGAVRNGPASGWVEAEVECVGSATEVKRVTVTDNPEARYDPAAGPTEIPGELAARCSFYYQDLLSKLFEEEETQMPRLLEFLRPSPKSVQVVQEAVKQAHKRWRSEIDRLVDSIGRGLPGESTINEDRKRAALAFRDAWQSLVDTASSEEGIALPRRSGEWLLLIRSGNLRSGWETELRNLAAECLLLFASNRELPAANEKPSVSLRLIEEALVALREEVVRRVGEVETKLRLLLEDQREDTPLLPPHVWPEYEREVAALSGEVLAKEKQVELLEKLERHFDNPAGPDLIQVLTALRDQGPTWLEVPDAGGDIGDMPPPSSTVEWLRKVTSYDLSRLVGELQAWQVRIGEQRTQLLQNLLQLRETLQAKTTLLKRSREVYALLREPSLGSRYKALIEKQPISLKDLKDLLGTEGARTGLLGTIDRAREAASRWREVEDLDERRLAFIQQQAGYLRAKDYMALVSAALERETGKNSVLGAAIVPPHDVLKELGQTISAILGRFRLVEGICPVRFETSRPKRGEAAPALQVYARDGRPLSALSTGHRAQLGLAMLLGLNYSLNSYIRHNVIALDDVTTAFDMAQLPRTAALIRQIAYVTEEVFARRQVFIVSHHEDLTNRLLDFLVPPAGRKLRILNFVNWRPDSGPGVEQREVEPGLAATAENSRKSLVDILEWTCRAAY